MPISSHCEHFCGLRSTRTAWLALSALLCAQMFLSTTTLAGPQHNHAQQTINSSYADLQGVRIAGNPDRTRLVLDAGRIGFHDTVFNVQDSRVILRLGAVSQTQANQQLRLWLRRLEQQDWVRSVRTSWDDKTGIFTAVINASEVNGARSFVLPPSNQSPQQRLVVDFIHSSVPVPTRAQTSTLVTPTPTAAAPEQKNLDTLIGQLMRTSNPQTPSPVREATTSNSTRTVKTSSSANARKLVIVVDAGHGGKDPGALGSKKRHEKVYTLKYARALALAIDRRPGMRAVLTRNSDEYISLRQRVNIATRAKADLFISLHADSFPSDTAKGSSVYALSLAGATSKTAQLMADDANSTIGFGGLQISNHDPMVAATLVDLAQTVSIEKSLDFGTGLLSKIKNFQRLHSAKVQQANFFVLRTAEYPSVLIELAFISNRREEKKLASKSFRRKFTRSIVESIEEFFRLNPPSGSYFALQR